MSVIPPLGTKPCNLKFCNLKPYSLNKWLGAPSIVALVVGIGAASAQTTVPDGTNLATLTPPVTADVWNLQGNAVLFDPAATTPSFALVMPVGTSGLTINGVAGGSTITLNDGAGHFGFFSNATASPVTLNLSNVIITGGLEPGSGGAINSGGNLTLNTSGVVSLTNDQASAGSGGAIVTNGMLTIVGGMTANGIAAPTTLTINSDSASAFGGAVYAANGLALTGSYNSILIQGDHSGASNNGAAFYVGGAPLTIDASVAGDFTVSNNTAGSNGAFWATQGFSIASTTSVGGTMAFTNNQSNAGAAIYSDAAISIGGTYGNIDFSDNTARAGRGGAIRAATSLTIDTTVSGTMAATGNSAAGDGGAFVATGGSVTITGSYGSINFSGNTSGTDTTGAFAVPGVQCGGGGGAICAGNGDLTISATVADTMTFADNNAVHGNGGALGANNGNVILDAGPGNISLTNNIATDGSGGAIYSTGTTTITGSTITLSGNQANSSSSFAVGGAINASGVSLAGSAISVVGNQANSASSFTQGGAIASSGPVTIGGVGSAITLSDNHANGTGSSGGAIFAVGSVSITGFGEISNNTTTGFGGAIIIGASPPFFSNGNVTLTASGGNLLVSGNQAGGLGGAIQMDAGTVDLEATDGSITFSRNMQNTAGAAQANAIYLGNVLGGSEVILNATAGHAITFFDPIQNNAADGLLSVTKTGAGAAVFDGSLYSNLADRWSQVYANTTVQGGTFAVDNNAVYGVLAADVGQTEPTSFTIDAGATLAGGLAGEVRADNFALHGILDISGATVLGHPSSGVSTFTISSSNVSLDGSQVLFNTYSGQLSDLLVLNLNGSATAGTASVIITSTSGLGTRTVGNGIQLVQTNNGTSTGAFSLLGNQVVAGAYAYMLFQGGVGADASNQNWYLRSTSMRPEVPVDTVVPALASRLGLAMLGTVSNRYGGDAGQFCADDEDIRKSGLYSKARLANVQCNTLLWGRMFGEAGSAGGGSVGANSDFGSAGPAYSFGYGGFQAGADLYRTARDNAGLYAGVANARSDVRMPDGGPAGRVGLDAYGVGGYWTHRSPSGWYTDLVLQGNWYENIHARSVAGLGLDTHGWGITASAEAGYQVALGDGYSVIPQGQIIYQRTDVGGGLDPFARISFGATDEIYGRLGARFAKGWLTNDGRTVTTWAETNVWHQFGDDAQTTFANLQGTSPATFAASLGGTWAQLGLGISGQITRNVSIFGNADYNLALNQPGHSAGGRAGFKVAW